jgi:hypothetical protein
VKKAELNDALKANTSKTAMVSSYNKRIRDALKPYTDDIIMGRVGNRMNKLMFEELKRNGTLNPGGLKWLEFNEEYPLDELLTSAWSWGKDSELRALFSRYPYPSREQYLELASLRTAMYLPCCWRIGMARKKPTIM